MPRCYMTISIVLNYILIQSTQEDRSYTNIPFVTGDPELDKKFVKEATEADLVNLKGHRSVGGMRASLYKRNAYRRC